MGCSFLTTTAILRNTDWRSIMGSPSSRRFAFFCLRESNMTRTFGVTLSRIASRFIALSFLSAGALFATLVAAKTLLTSSFQEKEKQAPHLYWNAPSGCSRALPVGDAALLASRCPEQAGQRAQELVIHLQRFIAHDQIRYKQTDSWAWAGHPSSLVPHRLVPNKQRCQAPQSSTT